VEETCGILEPLGLAVKNLAVITKCNNDSKNVGCIIRNTYLIKAVFPHPIEY
jgi:hypothetical protein